MTMFNSPLEFCSVIKEYVALDQTWRECLIEHRCEPDVKCPLRTMFADARSKTERKEPVTYAA